MTSVLEEIVARKRVDVAQRKRRVPPDSLRERAGGVARTRAISFANALATPGMRFILECKAKSPSEGELRGSNYDPATIARQYQGLADAISVVTDGPYFGGDLDHLRRVSRVTSVPILCKDFVVDPYQVVEARECGASAILLMLSVLDDATYRACAEEAARMELDVLTEVHDVTELQRAIDLGSKIIGINNRDLHTLRVDISTTRRLAPLVPADRRIVSESGFCRRSDWESISERVDAVLVGTHLMKSSSIARAGRELIFGRVKVCGLTSPSQAVMSHCCGATMGGVIFAKESPRCVSEEQSLAIASASPLEMVGVFVNDEVERIARLASSLSLSAVQLHGDETAEFIAQLRGLIQSTCEIWKAVRVQDSIPHVTDWNADRLVLDSGTGDQRGGTGQSFNWELIAHHPDREKFVLAGGIRPEKVRAAAKIGCWALDVNSGVESSPGVKDQDKLSELFASLRGEP